MKKLNIGLIGAGFMGKAHSLAYAAMPMFFWPAPAIPHRAMLADVTEESAREEAARFGFESSTGDWKKLVSNPSIDVVDIAAPNDLHFEIAVAAARAGKHIICEKPLARTAEEARLMYEAVKKAGVTHMVAFNYRRTPAVMLARKLIDEGAIGKLLNFRGSYMQDWSADPNFPLSWRFQKSVAGSGALGDIATHVLDMARYLAGEISAVQATVRTFIKERPVQSGGIDKTGAAGSRGNAPKAPVDVDDEVTASLRFAEGATGSLEATRNAYGRNNLLAFEIHGTRGSLVFNYERRDELKAFFADDPADRRGFRTIYTGPAHPYGQNLWPIPGIGIGYEETKIIECYDFIKAVVEKTQPSPSFRDGYQIERIAEAITRSSETKGWIEIEPLGH
jgi:predicted dehydrogenase